MSSRDVRILCLRPKWITSADKRMCRASCKKTYKSVTRQQRMGEQSRLFTWPDVNVLRQYKFGLFVHLVRVWKPSIIRESGVIMHVRIHVSLLWSGMKWRVVSSHILEVCLNLEFCFVFSRPRLIWFRHVGQAPERGIKSYAVTWLWS
jgi:hypothetical protein